MGCCICSVLCWVGLLLWAAWGVFAVRLTNKIFKKLDYLYTYDPNVMAKVTCGARYDQAYLRKWEIYIGSVVLIPIRLIVALPIFLTGQIFCFIFMKVYNVTPDTYYVPRDKIYFTLHYYVIGTLSRIVFFICGMYYMPTRHFNLNDFWAGYKPIQDVSKPPVIVSNHVSYLDMWMLLHLWENPGFLAKQSIQKLPVVGNYSMIHHCIYLNRDEKAERDSITQKIVERCKMVEEGKMLPLLIFPEGTTTNGRALMKFKKGAFFTEKPFYVYSLMYSRDPSFIPCFNLINPAFSAFIFISKFVNQVEYYRFDQPIDPLWILQKHGKKPQQEDNWELIAEETKKLMCFAFGFHSDQSSFQEKKLYDIEIQKLSEEEFKKRGQ